MPGKPEDKSGLPWNIEHPSPDTTRIFGLTLGHSTNNDAEQLFHESAIPSLFKSPDGRLVAEIFYEQVILAGLKSRIVTTIAVPDTELQAMYERGLRMSGTASGKKITLAPDDVARVRALPIASLTYMPAIRLEKGVVSKRFGQPAQRIKEKESGAIHWLYPQHGLDITLGGEEKPVLQYVPPRDFDKLIAPLLKSGEIIDR
ncbi:MAG: hypothetical protein OEV15_01810 [Gallionella sp.]|nr:hypothetical protein [Gallionella sp.]